MFNLTWNIYNMFNLTWLTKAQWFSATIHTKVPNLHNLYISLLCRRFFSPSPLNSDPSDLLSYNIAAHAIVFLVNHYLLSKRDDCLSSNLKSSSTKRFNLHFEVIIARLVAVASLTRIWKVNSDWPRKQLCRHIGTR